MDALNTPEAAVTPPSTARTAELRGLARLCAGLALLAAAVCATILAIVLLIPEQNDYGRASELKHRRLAQITTRKIVIVGGSNIAYGVDSKIIERATGCPVVNMGMNGYFGVRYMLEEVKDQINPSDIVVLSFEYDNLYKSVDGTPTNHIGLIKAYPTVLSYMTASQKMSVIAALPVVAQAKAMRLIEEAIEAIKRPITGKIYHYEGPADLNDIESLKSFSPEGDLVGHLGVKWPGKIEQAVVPEGATIDTEMVELMHGFAEDMQKRGVPVIVSYPPFMREAYDKLRGDLARFDAMIKSNPPLIAPSPPSAFVYDETQHFDTVYHLNERGRPVRTQRIADDLLKTLGERVRCP